MAAGPKDIGHDEAKTRTPKNPPGSAASFDRLVDATLELVAAVKAQTAEVREFTGEVRLLIRALASVAPGTKTG